MDCLLLSIRLKDLRLRIGTKGLLLSIRLKGLCHRIGIKGLLRSMEIKGLPLSIRVSISIRLLSHPLPHKARELRRITLPSLQPRGRQQTQTILPSLEPGGRRQTPDTIPTTLTTTTNNLWFDCCPREWYQLFFLRTGDNNLNPRMPYYHYDLPRFNDS